MRRFFVAILFSAALVLGISAQTPKANDAPAQNPPPSSAPMALPTPTPIPLSIVQMQQLTIVQTQRALAAESVAKAEAQYRALIAEFRWDLGVNPAEFDPQPQPLDQQGAVFGFVPKPKPQPPEPPKEAKPEPKQDGKQ